MNFGMKQLTVDTKSRAHEQAKLELRRCVQSIEIAKNELEGNEKAVQEFTQKLADCNVNQDELDKAAKIIEELEAKRNTLTDTADKIKRDYDAISKKIDAIYEEISGKLKKEVDEKKARQAEIEDKIKTLRNAASKAEIDLKKSKEKLENMKTSIVDMEKEITKLEDDKRETAENIEGLTALVEEKKVSL